MQHPSQKRGAEQWVHRWVVFVAFLPPLLKCGWVGWVQVHMYYMQASGGLGVMADWEHSGTQQCTVTFQRHTASTPATPVHRADMIATETRRRTRKKAPHVAVAEGRDAPCSSLCQQQGRQVTEPLTQCRHACVPQACVPIDSVM
jgi:hypothetical protein